jgi:ribosome maturation factor RimP
MAWIQQMASSQLPPRVASTARRKGARSPRRHHYHWIPLLPVAATNNADTDASSKLPPSLLPSNYQEVGQALVARAAASMGILPVHNDTASLQSLPTLSLEWKADTLVVTVWADNVYVSNPMSEEDDSDVVEAELLDDEDEDEELDDNNGMSEFPSAADAIDNNDQRTNDDVKVDYLDETFLNDADTTSSNGENGIDMVLLTRAISAALDSDVVGAVIAAHFGLQVTTPGASDVLSTPAMFRAYAGFEVMVQHQDAKTKGLKTIVGGRLVERNDTFLVLNIKGRVKKLKVSDVVSVRLPKAKKEKGGS